MELRSDDKAMLLLHSITAGQQWVMQISETDGYLDELCGSANSVYPFSDLLVLLQGDLDGKDQPAYDQNSADSISKHNDTRPPANIQQFLHCAGSTHSAGNLKAKGPSSFSLLSRGSYAMF